MGMVSANRQTGERRKEVAGDRMQVMEAVIGKGMQARWGRVGRADMRMGSSSEERR